MEPLQPVEIHRAHCDCEECWIGYSRPADPPPTLWQRFRALIAKTSQSGG